MFEQELHVACFNLHENTFDEHEQLCDSNLPLPLCLMIADGEQQFDSMHKESPGEDTQEDFRNEPLVVAQHEDHSKVQGHEEDDMHSVWDEPFLESQLVAHVEPKMEDEQTPLGHLYEEVTICVSEQWEVDRQFTSVFIALSLHQQSGDDLGLCLRLDQRAMMSWYAVGEATFTAEAIAQQEPWNIDALSWWHWDPGGY